MKSKHGNSDTDLKAELVAAVRFVAARQPITRKAVESELAKRNLGRWSPTRRSKTLLTLGKDFRARGQLGRLRAVVLIGTADLGGAFVRDFERTGLFLVKGQLRVKMTAFLEAFSEEIGGPVAEEWPLLSSRVSTYRAAAHLLGILTRHEHAATKILSQRPRFILKPLLALANLAFLRSYLGFEMPDKLGSLLDSVGTPETLASIVSALLALANSKFELDSLELGLPLVGDLEDPMLWSLIQHGRALIEAHEIAQRVSLLQYTVEECQGPSGAVFSIAATTQVEYSLRLGYVRADLHRGPDLTLRQDDDEVSMSTLAEVFVNHFRDEICEVRDPNTPLRGVRIKFPLMPELLETVTTASFSEDWAEREHLSQEFMYPLRWVDTGSEESFSLTPTLTLEAFRRMWRMCRFMALVDIAAIRPYVKGDFVMFVNSLVRVTKDVQTAELLGALGFTAAQVREFIELVSVDVSDFRFYDLQYRPYIHIAAGKLANIQYKSPQETIHLPALVASANILRNVQVANRIRFRDLPHIFVRVLSDLFRARFTYVTSNRKIRTEGGETDVDIVVYGGSRIYLFECKHSVFPAGPHETRDLLEDIAKGVKQVRLAEAALNGPSAKREYLARWFPALDVAALPELSVSVGILCSHRVLSGVEWEGVPVRDYASLSRLMQDGVVSITAAMDGDDIVSKRFCLIDEAGFSFSDLNDYLSPTSRYFRMYGHFMNAVCDPVRFSDVTIAYETFVLNLALDDWLTHMEEIGARPLPDARHKRERPRSWQHWAAELHRSVQP